LPEEENAIVSMFYKNLKVSTPTQAIASLITNADIQFANFSHAKARLQRC
jgi:hypothetical protein